MISAFKGKTIHIILIDCGGKGPGGVEWVLRKIISKGARSEYLCKVWRCPGAA